MPNLATVKLALPTPKNPVRPESLVSHLDGRDREDKVDVVVRAARVAQRAHANQFRKSGEHYYSHLLAVARILADLGLDEVAITAALLHDAVEDTRLELDDLRRAFGPEIAAIVNGVTKLDRVRFDIREAQQAANVRKMIIAMSKDLRVLLVALASLLQNLLTVAPLPDWKRERIGIEALNIYAPLVDRLGLQAMRQQIEDLSFEAIHPRRHAEVEYLVARLGFDDDYLALIKEDVRTRVSEIGLKAEVVGRKKSLYAVYEEMQVRDKTLDEVDDILRLRIIVETVRDCYAALGAVHAHWKPVPGRFKDYVSMPGTNLYMSLHTTVVGPQGKAIRFQIRTKEMHERAESGIAARYHGNNGGDASELLNLPRWTQSIDLEKNTSDLTEFMQNPEVDLQDEELYVFTPQGRVTTLPVDSTPIDFAYAIHTDVGDRCVGAKVDGRLVPLSEPLQTGQTVEIFTSKVVGAGPSRDWLNFVSSHRAASNIRKWFSRARRQDAIAQGENDLKRALKREGVAWADLGPRPGAMLQTVASALNHLDADALYAAIGEHSLNATTVARRLLTLPQTPEGHPSTGEAVTERRAQPQVRNARVQGHDDAHLRLSRCCSPSPGDEIMGFVTRGRGISIHRTDCANAISLASSLTDRLVEAGWDDGAGEKDHIVVSVELKAYDRPQLLADVSSIFADHRATISRSSSSSNVDRVAVLAFTVELAESADIDALIRSLRAVDGVYDVTRH